MSDDKNPQTFFGEGVEDLSRVVEGVAGLLLGKSRPAAEDREEGDDLAPEPVISEPVDRAIQDLGGALGQILLVAGDHLQAATGEVAEERVGDDPTPLVHGARSFGKGLGALAGDLLGSLQAAAAPPSAPAGAEEPPLEEAEEQT